MRNGNLGLQAGLVHHLNSLTGVGTLGSLTRQHYTVRSVQHGIGNVGHLSTSRAGVICHGLEHLGGADDRLTLNVTLGDHHLLGNEDLGGRNLDAQVTTGNHDTVRLLENFIEVVDTLLVLNLGNDLNLLTLFAENFTDMTDVTSTADERSKDHLNLVLNTKFEVVNVFLGEGWEVDISARQVNTFPGADFAVIQTLDAQGLVIYNLEDLEGEDTIVDIDQLARFDHPGDVLVVDVPGTVNPSDMGYVRSNLHVLIIAARCILVISGDVELLVLADWEVLVTAGVTGTNFRSFLQGVRIVRIHSTKPLTVSRAMARGRPVCTFSASRAWLITDWWYWANQQCPPNGANETNIIGTVREVHADDIQTGYCGVSE